MAAETNIAQAQKRVEYFSSALKNAELVSFLFFIITVGITAITVHVKWLQTLTFISVNVIIAGLFLISFSGLLTLRKQLEEAIRQYEYLSGSPSAHRKDLKRINKWIGALAMITLVLAGIFIGVRGYHHIRQKQASERDGKMLEEVRSKYPAVVKQVIPPMFTDFEYTKSITATGSSSMRYDSYGYYDWYNTINVTIEVTDKFDKLSDRRIYEYLCDMNQKGGFSMINAVMEALPEYKELHNRAGITDGRNLRYKGYPVLYDCEFNYYVKSPKNKYQYANNVKDYYLLNGKDHFLRDKGSQWAKPTPTPTPKSSKKSTSGGSSKHYIFDYDDVHNYDDPEDWWEDHEDEFEDFYDAWDYWEENQ